MAFEEIRREYTIAGLDEGSAASDPFDQFDTWFQQSLDARVPLANTLILSTADAKARPSVRAVLMKSFDRRGFVFYTDYASRKAEELTDNPWASGLFWWEPLERQVRIEGSVTRTSEAESDEYFFSRPLGSRLGAWASPQSQAIPDRASLEARVAEMEARHGSNPPRPPGWGGFRLAPSRFEFWQGRPDRLHDRLCYVIDLEGHWSRSRLAP